MPLPDKTCTTLSARPLSVAEIKKRAKLKKGEAGDRIEVQKGADAQWYLRIVNSGNREIVWTAEGSEKKSVALERACRSSLLYGLPVLVITESRDG